MTAADQMRKDPENPGKTENSTGENEGSRASLNELVRLPFCHDGDGGSRYQPL